MAKSVIKDYATNIGIAINPDYIPGTDEKYLMRRKLRHPFMSFLAMADRNESPSATWISPKEISFPTRES
jgi:hypothetical protein